MADHDSSSAAGVPASALERLPDWRSETHPHPKGKDGTAVQLVRSYRFESFEDAVHFMATAARFIARTDHHPVWENSYRDLHVRLTTFDAGMRVTGKDVTLAGYLDSLFAEYQPGG